MKQESWGMLTYHHCHLTKTELNSEILIKNKILDPLRLTELNLSSGSTTFLILCMLLVSKSSLQPDIPKLTSVLPKRLSSRSTKIASYGSVAGGKFLYRPHLKVATFIICKFCLYVGRELSARSWLHVASQNDREGNVLDDIPTSCAFI